MEVGSSPRSSPTWEEENDGEEDRQEGIPDAYAEEELLDYAVHDKDSKMEEAAVSSQPYLLLLRPLAVSSQGDWREVR